MVTQQLFFPRCRERAGWRVSFRFFLVLCSLELGYVSNARAQAIFTTLDVPGAAGNGTFAFSINSAGAITGNYQDANYVDHAFLRSPAGTFTAFDVPGASSTYATSINAVGSITGQYTDVNSVVHGFLRSPDGSFTTFDIPGAQAILPESINAAGAITGQYFNTINANSDAHGFLRAPDGTFTLFDVPGAGTQVAGGTYASSINPAGAITGIYVDADRNDHS